MALFEDFTILTLIHSMSAQFTKTDWKIAKFIEKNSNRFISMSALDIAQETGCSDASVIRFAQKIGFAGFYELRLQLKKELDEDRNKKTQSNEFDLINQYAKLFTQFQQSCSLDSLLKLSLNIKQCPLIYTCAFKNYSSLSNNLSQKLLNNGIHSIQLSSMSELKIAIKHAQSNTCFIIFTQGAYDDEIRTQIKTIISKNIALFTISDKVLANLDDLHTHFTSPQNLITKVSLPNSFEVLSLILIDLINQTIVDQLT